MPQEEPQHGEEECLPEALPGVEASGALPGMTAIGTLPGVAAT